MTKKIVNSRTPELNIEKCIDKAGGNRYAMVIERAQRARELAKGNLKSQSYTNAVVSSLLELQEDK